MKKGTSISTSLGQVWFEVRHADPLISPPHGQRKHAPKQRQCLIDLRANLHQVGEPNP